MLSTVLLSLTLGSPPVATREYADRFAYVEVELAPEAGEVVVFDARANVVGVIVTWIDGYGDIWITSEYDDGYGDIRIAGDRVSTFGELPENELAIRAEAIASLLDGMPEAILGPDAIAEKNSWWKCGRWAAGAAVACYAARPLACVGSGVQAACTCVPKIVKEFEHMECPWNA